MFSRLFAESGLSLDRLRALLEVGAAGSIAKATDGDPVRQSQYSRQIKELEDFFRVRLIERQGKGIRLTPNGKELARISRFFMLGLSNFQRGCLVEEQAFHVGASATIIRQFLLPALSDAPLAKDRTNYTCEVVAANEIERRLHDLTLDFGILGGASLSRPLQATELGQWKLELWAPKALRITTANAAHALSEKRLSLVLAKELQELEVLVPKEYAAQLICDSFLEAKVALEGGQVAALLPEFLAPGKGSKPFVRIQIPKIDSRPFFFYLAWNPRLLRLNPHATRMRDALAKSLSKRMAG